MSAKKKVIAPPNKNVSAVRKLIETKPGAVGGGLARFPAVTLYKVVGKMFAILTSSGTPNVILKCDPHLMDVLKHTYDGVGHRSHLDKRFWISVELDADVPLKEIGRMIDHSYDQVCEKLSKKEAAELEKLGGKKPTAAPKPKAKRAT